MMACEDVSVPPCGRSNATMARMKPAQKMPKPPSWPTKWTQNQAALLPHMRPRNSHLQAWRHQLAEVSDGCGARRRVRDR